MGGVDTHHKSQSSTCCLLRTISDALPAVGALGFARFIVVCVAKVCSHDYSVLPSASLDECHCIEAVTIVRQSVQSSSVSVP